VVTQAVAWRRRLRRLSDFNRLWAGQTVSQFGTQVSYVALPLTGVLTLHASAVQLGVLMALFRAPFLLYPIAGVWVDRVRRRPVLITADVARAVLLMGVPAATALHLLRIELLYVTIFGLMVLTAWFDIAYMSYVPSLVERERLVQANSRLEISNSAAQIGGPGLAGLLVQLLTAPFAIVADSCSFVCSALAVTLIRRREPAPPPAQGRSVRSELREGARFVFGQPLLRVLVVAVGLGNFFWALQQSIYLLFVGRELHLPPAVIGLVLAGTGAGAVVGTLLAAAALRRLGLGRTLIAGLGAFATGAMLVPLAPASSAVAPPLLVAAQVLMGLGFQMTSINVLTARQIVSPPELLGRSNATFRFVALGVAPFGALAGGALGSVIGLRPALLAAGLGLMLCPLVLGISPVRSLRNAG
jgi:MFS family permease